MSKRCFIALTVLSPFLWLMVLLSVSFFLFYWRIVLEPGVFMEPKGLLWAALLLLGAGLCGTITVNVMFLVYREKRFWIAWLLDLGACILYGPFFVLTLVMMA